MYLPNDSSETSHSSDLVKRKVISSIDGKDQRRERDAVRANQALCDLANVLVVADREREMHRCGAVGADDLRASCVPSGAIGGGFAFGYAVRSHGSALLGRREMRKRHEIGVRKSGDGAAHDGVRTRAGAVTQFLQRFGQVVDALFANARDLILAGKISLRSNDVREPSTCRSPRLVWTSPRTRHGPLLGA